MAGQPGFFDADERLEALSVAGDPLERLSRVVEFEVFGEDLEAALVRSDRAKGGRPPYDAVMMFKVLVLQTLHTLSDDATEYQLKDRLSFMRFCGLALHDAVPDAKTIWLYREQLMRAGALQRLFERFDAILRERGYLAMGGQIVDATGLSRLSGIPCKDRCYHAKVKRSSNRMASCALAMLHSRGGIFHSFAARFNTRKRSLSALSSVGKCPLVLTARRSLAFKLSIEFVV